MCRAVQCTAIYHFSSPSLCHFNGERITCIFDGIRIKADDLKTLLYCHTAIQSGPAVQHFKCASLQCHIVNRDEMLLFCSDNVLNKSSQTYDQTQRCNQDDYVFNKKCFVFSEEY